MKATEFANRIYDLYPPFRDWSDETLKVWMTEVVGQSGEFPDHIRAKAFKLLTTKTHKEKPPQIAVIIEQCRLAEREFNVESGKQGNLIPGSAATAVENDYGHGTADLLIEGALGRQAAQEGWIGELHGFIAKHKRLPQGSEIGACKTASKETDEWIRAALSRDGKTPGESAVARSAENILNRRKKLADLAYGLEKADASSKW